MKTKTAVIAEKEYGEMSAALPDHYYIDKRDGLVSIWSTDRLPFQPKGWKLTFREDIQEALRSTLIPVSHGSLYAALISPDSDRFDVENVLFYNVGVGTFSSLCRSNICFERYIEPLPKCLNLDNSIRYMYLYQTISENDDFRYWIPQGTLAEWNDIPIPSLKGTHKPHTFWYALKSYTTKYSDNCCVSKHIGLTLQIKAPRQYSVNLAAVMKPLIDGIISAMHWESQVPSPHVLNYLSKALGKSPESVAELLLCRKGAVLGPRSLIHAFQQGIQWNPADDSLVAVRITFEPCQLNNQWLLSGSLHKLIKR